MAITKNHGTAVYRFTLIELLVIIVIITILASLLLPALNVARNKGYAISCSGQLKQMGTLLQMYMGDSQDYFMPYQGYTTSSTYASTANFTEKGLKWKRVNGVYQNGVPTCNSVFVVLVMMYMRGDFGLMYCPGDKREYVNPSIYSENNSYAYEFTVLGKGQSRKTVGFDTPRMQDLKQPSAQIVFGESSRGRGVVADVPSGSGWMYFYDPTFIPMHDPHNRTYGFLFADGHASNYKFNEVLKMGNNFKSGLR